MRSSVYFFPMQRMAALCLRLSTVLILPGCADSMDGGDSAASPALVQSTCRSYGAYVDACMVDTDGFDEDACNAWFSKHYRSDVLSALRQCYDGVAAGSCDPDTCSEALADDLQLGAEQNRDEPTLKACVARVVQCTGDDSGGRRCEQVLLYTEAGRKSARHCFTEAVACGDLRDCIRFPDSF